MKYYRGVKEVATSDITENYPTCFECGRKQSRMTIRVDNNTICDECIKNDENSEWVKWEGRK